MMEADESQINQILIPENPGSPKKDEIVVPKVQGRDSDQEAEDDVSDNDDIRADLGEMKPTFRLVNGRPVGAKPNNPSFDRSKKFHDKLYMAASTEQGSFIRWSENGKSILVIPSRFEVEVMATFDGLVQVGVFSNFRRQMREYGFSWYINNDLVFEFSHPLFQRGREDLLKTMRSRFAAKKFSTLKRRKNKTGGTANSSMNDGHRGHGFPYPCDCSQNSCSQHRSNPMMCTQPHMNQCPSHWPPHCYPHGCMGDHGNCPYGSYPHCDTLNRKREMPNVISDRVKLQNNVITNAQLPNTVPVSTIQNTPMTQHMHASVNQVTNASRTNDSVSVDDVNENVNSSDSQPTEQNPVTTAPDSINQEQTVLENSPQDSQQNTPISQMEPILIAQHPRQPQTLYAHDIERINPNNELALHESDETELLLSNPFSSPSLWCNQNSSPPPSPVQVNPNGVISTDQMFDTQFIPHMPNRPVIRQLIGPPHHMPRILHLPPNGDGPPTFIEQQFQPQPRFLGPRQLVTIPHRGPTISGPLIPMPNQQFSPSYQTIIEEGLPINPQPRYRRMKSHWSDKPKLRPPHNIASMMVENVGEGTIQIVNANNNQISDTVIKIPDRNQPLQIHQMHNNVMRLVDAQNMMLDPNMGQPVTVEMQEGGDASFVELLNQVEAQNEKDMEHDTVDDLPVVSASLLSRDHMSAYGTVDIDGEVINIVP